MFLPKYASARYLLLGPTRLTQPKPAALQQQTPSPRDECLPPFGSPCPYAIYNKAAVCYAPGIAGQSFLRSPGGVQTCCRNWSHTEELTGSLTSSPLRDLKRKPQCQEPQHFQNTWNISSQRFTVYCFVSLAHRPNVWLTRCSLGF